MAPPAALFLSPHPDDLVYSAFAEIANRRKKRTAVIVFNTSRFTKWGLLPKNLVTMMRTVEEEIILASLGLRSSFLWMEDSSARKTDVDMKNLASSLDKFRGHQLDLFCPLGLTEHPDHVAVRDLAVNYWLKCERRPRLCFYEDLPYAARIDTVDREVRDCINRLSLVCPRISICYRPMTAELFRKKLIFSRLYLTQNDHTKLLEKHGRGLGERCGSPYAEKYVCTPVGDIQQEELL